MIIDLKKFIAREQPYWYELADLLKARDDDPHRLLDLSTIRRLHYLYQRASADLGKIGTFAAEPGVRTYLESLVGRAYAAIHSSRKKAVRIAPLHWAGVSLPSTFRRHWRAFGMALAVLLIGCLFGATALVLDPEAKAVLMPFAHLQMDPAERVAREELPAKTDRLEGAKGQFSAFLMTHNTRIAVLVLALGMTWGIGTIVLLFSNGVMLGAVAADYIRAGEGLFLSGWLLPHGVIEIPAIVIAGQAGLLLASALIDRSTGLTL
ncbi:stage II sporulation protein M, partial [Desulfosarcina cetonica]|uniref:stage II sporulation protein M n=1 Tax=Desulfosarcina cetonica TaxID=90730 RepID=UPI0006D21EFF